MTELKDEQIIADAPGLRRKGHIKRGGARLVVVRDKVLRNIQEHGLLHPLAFVEHHVSKHCFTKA